MLELCQPIRNTFSPRTLRVFNSSKARLTIILEELRRVLPRLAHRHGLTEVEMNDLVDILSIQADTIEPLPNTEPALRDIDDLPVLGTFLAAFEASSADYLVTGGKDLLAISEHYPIMTPREFWTRHGGV